jgi:dUTP pyrophosphatase
MNIIEKLVLKALQSLGDKGRLDNIVEDILNTPLPLKMVNLTTDLPYPSHKTTGAAGLDLYANIPSPVTLKPFPYLSLINDLKALSTGKFSDMIALYKAIGDISNDPDIFNYIAIIPTGIIIEIPDGHEGSSRIRSGISTENNISCLTGIGTIDSDFRGESYVAMINLGNKPYIINRKDRIGQMVITRHRKCYAVPSSIEDLSVTARGDKGGFSTGR